MIQFEEVAVCDKRAVSHVDSAAGCEPAGAAIPRGRPVEGALAASTGDGAPAAVTARGDVAGDRAIVQSEASAANKDPTAGGRSRRAAVTAWAPATAPVTATNAPATAAGAAVAASSDIVAHVAIIHSQTTTGNIDRAAQSVAAVAAVAALPAVCKGVPMRPTRSSATDPTVTADTTLGDVATHRIIIEGQTAAPRKIPPPSPLAPEPPGPPGPPVLVSVVPAACRWHPHGTVRSHSVVVDSPSRS